jgi:hypothetical protein
VHAATQSLERLLRQERPATRPRSAPRSPSSTQPRWCSLWACETQRKTIAALWLARVLLSVVGAEHLESSAVFNFVDVALGESLSDGGFCASRRGRPWAEVAGASVRPCCTPEAPACEADDESENTQPEERDEYEGYAEPGPSPQVSCCRGNRRECGGCEHGRCPICQGSGGTDEISLPGLPRRRICRPDASRRH